MAITTEARCEHCGSRDVRLDERGWCEQCVLDREAAYQLFHDLEAVVVQSLDTGALTSAQLQEALRMSLGNVDGALTGTGFRREAVETDERGVWELPASAFDGDPRGRRNRIAFLRHGARLSLEAVAERAGVTAETLGLWEQDAQPADGDRPAVDRLAALFGVSPAFLFGLDAGEVA